MPRSHRVVPIALAVASLISSACSARESSAVSCSSDAECPATSRCLASACVADASPTARVTVPTGTLEEFALLEFDGSASSDPDPGDAVSTYAWTFRSLTAPCDPPVVAGTGSLAVVRFSCAGRYAVDLVVRDGLDVASTTTTEEVEVAPFSGTSVVQSGAEIAVDHACAGTPAVCAASQPIALSSSVSVAGATVHWTVQPPANRPLGPTRRVTFTPSADALSPTVTIESDSGAVSGDWVFRVEARDTVGVLGYAYTPVSVLNRSPVVSGVPLAQYDHSFDTGSSKFVSTGEIAYVVSDPDGDPLGSPAVTWRHVADGQSLFQGTVVDGVVSFTVEVPYAAAGDELKLIGGAGLERSVDLVIHDVNGAAGHASWPIVIGNHAPTTTSGGGTVDASHTFDATASQYVAHSQLAAWSDPDGDPLSIAYPGAAPCAALALDGSTSVVDCSLPYTGVPAVQQFAGPHAVQVRVRDPWVVSSNAPQFTVNILNRPPTLAVSTSDSTVVCGPLDACCVYSGTTCIKPGRQVTGGTYWATPIWSDPDGDPVRIDAAPSPLGGSVAPSTAVCSGTSCASFQVTQPGTNRTCYAFDITSSMTASDGAASATKTFLPPGCSW